MARLKVRVTPGGREDAILAWQGTTLRVRVRAAPERGKANEALCRLLARKLGVPASAVSVARGGGSRDKLVAIEGKEEADVMRIISADKARREA